jgi:hypothetical protein
MMSDDWRWLCSTAGSLHFEAVSGVAIPVRVRRSSTAPTMMIAHVAAFEAADSQIICLGVGSPMQPIQ